MNLLLIKTLIGIFITPIGIIVGANTAMSHQGRFIGTTSKYCQTTSLSVATIQGTYSAARPTSGVPEVEPLKQFTKICDTFAEGTPVQQQAIRFADQIRRDFAGFGARISSDEFGGLINPADPHIVYVMVAG